MPRLYICPEPGCGRLHPRKGLCPEHRRAREAKRNAQPHRHVYSDSRWKKARKACLQRDGYRCRYREDGRRCQHVDPTGRTLHAHHHPLPLRTLVAMELDPFDTDRLVTLCHSHHSQIEARQQSRPGASGEHSGHGQAP